MHGFNRGRCIDPHDFLFARRRHSHEKGVRVHHFGKIPRAGADGVAVVSAIVAKPDPREAAQAIRLAIDENCGKRRRRLT